jgi:hypothetical protein
LNKLQKSVSSFNLPACLLGKSHDVQLEIFHNSASMRNVQQVCFSFFNIQTISFVRILDQFLEISKVTSALMKCEHFSLFGNPAVSDRSDSKEIICSWKQEIVILVHAALTENKKAVLGFFV